MRKLLLSFILVLGLAINGVALTGGTFSQIITGNVTVQGMTSVTGNTTINGVTVVTGNVSMNGNIVVNITSSAQTLYNVTMTTANVEYSQVLPDGTHVVSVSVQGGVDTDNYRLAWATGKVAGPTAPYFQADQNVEYYRTELSLTGFTLYFASSVSGKVMQISTWQ